MELIFGATVAEVHVHVLRLDDVRLEVVPRLFHVNMRASRAAEIVPAAVAENGMRVFCAAGDVHRFQFLDAAALTLEQMSMRSVTGTHDFLRPPPPIKRRPKRPDIANGVQESAPARARVGIKPFRSVAAPCEPFVYMFLVLEMI